ncbi:MAG: hypothetical protein IJC51_05890 [Eggerthellaceae bacterium]|nr:hypothetical protein [Eggerthellaceae bacterium]
MRLSKAAKASLLLVVATLGVLGIEAVWDALPQRQGDGASATGAFAAPDSLDSLDSLDADSVPSWFHEEVMSLDGCENVRAWESDCVIVGFTVPRPMEEAVREIATGLNEKGWKAVESGVDAVRTFVKDEGACAWVAVSCVEVAGEVSVVVQCASREGRLHERGD